MMKNIDSYYIDDALGLYDATTHSRAINMPNEIVERWGRWIEEGEALQRLLEHNYKHMDSVRSSIDNPCAWSDPDK